MPKMGNGRIGAAKFRKAKARRKFGGKTYTLVKTTHHVSEANKKVHRLRGSGRNARVTTMVRRIPKGDALNRTGRNPRPVTVFNVYARK